MSQTIGVVNFVPGCTAAYTWLHATGMQVNFLSFNQIAEIKRKNVNQLHSQKHHHFIINDNQTTEHLHIIIEVAISQEPNQHYDSESMITQNHFCGTSYMWSVCTFFYYIHIVTA